MMPTVGNNIVWRSLYRNAEKIYSDRIRVGWFSEASVREGGTLPLIEVDDLTAAEKARNQHRSFERFAWFSDGWVARNPGDARVLGDMRYSLSAEAFDPIWGIRFTDPNTPAEVAWINRTRERKIEPGELWREITGADIRFKPVDQLY
jgi:inner membrane protein